MENHEHVFRSKQKANDFAVWLMFEKRRNNFRFKVIEKNHQFHVLPETAHVNGNAKVVDIINDYSNIDYSDIQALWHDREGLSHWEKVRDMLSSTDGETLRFIIAHHVPFEKLIRFELANRGYDINHLWCGFDEARKIWLK